MKVAVLDLGTNVFNLLIADISKERCKIERVLKVPSYIGSSGFSTGYLSKEAIESSIESLAVITAEIKNAGKIDLVKAFATSAVRDARNGSSLIDEIKVKFGMDVEVITGDREAELIYKGVRESLLLYNEKVLICDIGGGSVEMIIADKKRIFWKESFNLGVVRLREIFKPEDPITKSQIAMIESFLCDSLGNLWSAYRVYRPKLMVGTSGTFDTFRELVYSEDDGTLPAMNIEFPKLGNLHEKLICSTREERTNMSRMSPIRVDYIVLGSIFVQLVIGKCHIEELCQSNYSLKEGFMAEIAESLNKR